MGTPDLSEFVALTRTKQRKPCAVATATSELPKDDAERLEAAIVATETGHVSVSAVIEWCHQRGHEVTQNQVVRHRQRKCVCNVG